MGDLIERLNRRRPAAPPWDHHTEFVNPDGPEAASRITELRQACARQNEEICQTLGKALGYPWFKDDQANFPGSAKEHGVCVGDHVAESIADEAAKRIAELEAENARLRRDDRIGTHSPRLLVIRPPALRLRHTAGR